MYGLKEENHQEIETILNEIKANKKVQDTKNYIQHGKISTFAHCESVANLSYAINQKFHLNADLDTLLKGAMLHDFYLYDWHKEDDGSHHLHGFRHAERAAKNAETYFDIDYAVRHIIRCHMWPLNITKIPRSKEAWIVCLADKYVSLLETVNRRQDSNVD